MTWLPSLLSWPGALLAALAVLPPLILLYFLKLRRKEQEVPSTLLWKKAIQDLQVNAPFQRLRRNLLLLLQILVLLFLLLALAEPVMNYSPGPTSTTLILIDRSASMSTVEPGGKSRLEIAQEMASNLVDSMGSSARATVIAFDESAETMIPFTGDKSALKAAIARVQPSHRLTRMKQTAALVEAQSRYQEGTAATPQLPDVYLYSDGRIDDATDVALRGNVKFMLVGSDQAPNLAITSLSARRNYERPTEVQVFAALTNFGPETVTAQVEVRVDDRLARILDATVLPDRWTQAQRDQAIRAGSAPRDKLEFTAELSDRAVISLRHLAQGDALPLDDAAWVVVPPPRSLAVLLVTDGNYFLERVIDILGLNAPKRMTTRDYESQKPTDFDVVLFDRHRPTFLPPAGSFVYFGAPPPAGSRLEPLTDADGWQIANDNGTLDWKRDHPMLRGMNLGRLFAARSLRLKLPLEAETLIDGTTGPLLVMLREGRVSHLVFTFDLLESNWPLQRTFPATLNLAMRFMAVGSDMDVRESFAPGSAIRVPRVAVQRLGQGVERVRLSGPGGASLEAAIPPDGDIVLPPIDRVGLWRTEPPVDGFDRIAVNLLSGEESNVLPVANPPGGVGQTIAAGQASQARLDLWWYLVAFAAIPLVLIEWLIYTRRMHL